MDGNREQPRDRIGRFCKVGGEDREIVRPAARPRKPAKGWPKKKEAVFFRELGVVCDLGSALKSAGLIRQAGAVQQRLKSDSGFIAQWEAALDASCALLQLEMFGRVRFGGDRPEPATPVERKLRRVPDSVALQLIKLHQGRKRSHEGAAGAAGPRFSRLEARELRKRLEAKLADFNRRMGGEG